MHILKSMKSMFCARLCLVCACMIPLMGCVEKKMTLEQAKQVSVSMRASAFVPPPRSINDILDILNQPGDFDKTVTDRIRKKADAKPPDTDDPATLSFFYRNRGRWAKDLGRAEQELNDARMALMYARQSERVPPKAMSTLLRFLGSAETRLGNFKNGHTFYREALNFDPVPGNYLSLAESLFKLGDFKGGGDVITQGLEVCEQLQNRKKGGAKMKIQAEAARMTAAGLTARGSHKKAEPHWREYHRILRNIKSKKPAIYLKSYYYLAKNLKSQGRLVEAEIQIRKGLTGAVAHTGKNSGLTATMAAFFGEILLAQGRVADAQKMILASMACYRGAGTPESSMAVNRVRILLGETRFAQKDISGALDDFLAVKKHMMHNEYIYSNKIAQNHTILLSFLNAGLISEAAGAIDRYFDQAGQYMEKKDYKKAEMTAFRGMVHSLENNQIQALDDFKEAMPILLGEKEKGFLKHIRRELITESYAGLLMTIRDNGQEKQFDLDVPALIFSMCEQLNSSTVKSDLGASGARAAAMDPALADLVRKEQDAGKQISAMKQALMNAVSAPANQLDSSALSELQADLYALGKARQTLLEEIRSQFPKYADFISPDVPSFETIQNNLTYSETMIVMAPVSNRMFLWGIPKAGPVVFTEAAVTLPRLKEQIRALRKTLAPSPQVFEDIPAFDLALAHELYITLFQPLGSAWKQSKDLIVVSPGVLGQIPFGILPTAKVQPGFQNQLLYDNYRRVPWLIRQVSLTRLPSVSSLGTLRALPVGNPGRQPFIGFGDPVFNLSQLSVADTVQTGRGPDGQLRSLRTRGIRKVEKSKSKPTVQETMTLGSLIRLPDTSAEILEIASVTGADESGGVFLGKQANEVNVKQIDLSQAKIIAFASHGLIPGDLDGLDQPAIALTAPEVINDFTEDGLLQMGEILRLTLNADWVILSACNTGAADGAGAEAVSGLGRAFFYAGTRALLVTMWAVESTSARELTSGVFRFQKHDPGISRARALQKSIIHLIDEAVLANQGNVVASYAHPFFWAPFIVVGDGG